MQLEATVCVSDVGSASKKCSRAKGAHCDGHPTESTKRRWQRFGLSGAKLIFGGEAIAVCPDGRGNPNQLMMIDDNCKDMTELRILLTRAHEERFGNSEDLMIGLQLAHAGRFSRPYDLTRTEPKILYHHPLLDQKVGITPDDQVMSDEEITRIVNYFIKAAILAQNAGFDFVDIKHCHGFLGHEFLSAVERPGRYGGSFENRTRFLREIVTGIRKEVPRLGIAVRLSAFDLLPYQRNKEGRGEPIPFNSGSYPYAFGGDGTGQGIDLTEPLRFLDLLTALDIKLICISASGGNLNPHIMRPSILPSSDGYKHPEDPLIGVARLISITAELKQQRPGLLFVGSAYSYLQQWLPNVAQGAVSEGKVDIVGIGRMALSYPSIVADILDGKPLNRNLLCRACDDCITSLSLGLISGCYVHDEYYRNSTYGQQLRHFKRSKKANRAYDAFA